MGAPSPVERYLPAVLGVYTATFNAEPLLEVVPLPGGAGPLAPAALRVQGWLTLREAEGCWVVRATRPRDLRDYRRECLLAHTAAERACVSLEEALVVLMMWEAHRLTHRACDEARLAMADLATAIPNPCDN